MSKLSKNSSSHASYGLNSREFDSFAVWNQGFLRRKIYYREALL